MNIDKYLFGEIVSIMLETVCKRRKTIRIDWDDYLTKFVKVKFMKLNSCSIKFVFDYVRENTIKIRNIKQYLKEMPFNVHNTIDSYYITLVNYDMYCGSSLPDYSCNYDVF